MNTVEMDARTLAMLGVLAAVGTILRPLSAGTAGFELIFFVLILGGRVFGAGFGFALGAITMVSSALITSGVGPWLPYQMLAAGFVGYRGLSDADKRTLTDLINALAEPLSQLTSTILEK